MVWAPGLDFDGAVAAGGAALLRPCLGLPRGDVAGPGLPPAKAASINFNELFARSFEDGMADGSLTRRGGDRAEAAELLFSTARWSCVHLRGRQRWSAERARHGPRRLTMPGPHGRGRSGTRPASS